MVDTLRLFYGTLLLRPYVFIFLLIYLVAACTHLGWKRTLLYLPLGYSIAFASEFSSIRWGFPYGDYYYIPATIDRELWVFGVPFMDSLSYVFLSYCSFSMAVFLLSPVAFATNNALILETREVRRSWKTLTLGAFLFVLLDLIIDPVALQGHKWFLGQIYGYREVGTYFGVPMSNFWGWLVVGYVMIAAIQSMDRVPALDVKSPSVFHSLPGIALLGPVLYVSVLAFNLAVTFWIGETLLGLVGCLILFFPFLLALFFTLYKQAHLTPEQIGNHLMDFPVSPAASLLGSTVLEAAPQRHLTEIACRKP